MIVVEGMYGLGDNIFQRAYVKTLAQRQEVYLYTSWPELYDDLPAVRFVQPITTLRTQAKNIRRQKFERWAAQPSRRLPRIRVRYGAAELRGLSIPGAMEKCFGVPPGTWDLPEVPAYPRQRVAVVRPVTERREWFNCARNPRPEYIAAIARELMRTHFVISVADLAAGAEWLVGESPPAHLHLHHGELDVLALLGLIETADVVVGGVGWIVPACIAAKTPLFVVLGGHGGHNAPDRITDPRMDLSRVGFAIPDRFCRCADMRHNCDKTNQRLAIQWAEWREQVGV